MGKSGPKKRVTVECLRKHSRSGVGRMIPGKAYTMYEEDALNIKAGWPDRIRIIGPFDKDIDVADGTPVSQSKAKKKQVKKNRKRFKAMHERKHKAIQDEEKDTK